MLLIKPCAQMQAASKIVCTLGPACRDVETLMKLINAGMTAARVDLTVRQPPALPALTLDALIHSDGISRREGAWTSNCASAASPVASQSEKAWTPRGINLAATHLELRPKCS